MTVNRNAVAGAALVVLGAAMGAYAQSFPTVRGMSYGPGFFPTIVAGGLILSGIGVVLERDADDLTMPLPTWRAIIAVPAVIAFFALTIDTLGFHISAAIALLVSVRAFGGRWTVAVVAAIVGPVALHALFYSLIRVPLPWGLLLPVAW